MTRLPPDADLEQLRRRAKELLRAAREGDATARSRLAAVDSRLQLSTAQLALAREHGFSSWPAMQLEISCRRLLDLRDPAALAAFVRKHPEAVTAEVRQWLDHPEGASPLGYLAMARYDTVTKRWREVSGAAASVQILLASGAPVDGPPGAPETPLSTAASYGDAEIAAVLIAAGADLEAVAASDSGGVPGGTAVLHAAVFGMTAVLDVLVAAGAAIRSIEEAAAAGDLEGWLGGRRDREFDAQAGARALVMAADHQRLDCIDALVGAGVPVDATDERWHRHPLRLAVTNGRPSAVAALLSRGADPLGVDAHGATALDLCRRAAHHAADPAVYREIEAMLVQAAGN